MRSGFINDGHLAWAFQKGEEDEIGREGGNADRANVPVPDLAGVSVAALSSGD